jgi:hypothetical protein
VDTTRHKKDRPVVWDQVVSVRTSDSQVWLSRWSHHHIEDSIDSRDNKETIKRAAIDIYKLVSIESALEALIWRHFFIALLLQHFFSLSQSHFKPTIIWN